jgi:hypothetical protein
MRPRARGLAAGADVELALQEAVRQLRAMAAAPTSSRTRTEAAEGQVAEAGADRDHDDAAIRLVVAEEAAAAKRAPASMGRAGRAGTPS